MYSADLFKNHINILGINYLRGNEYAITFEFSYINKDKSKVWAKSVAIVRAGELLSEAVGTFMSDELIKSVQQMRSELEG